MAATAALNVLHTDLKKVKAATALASPPTAAQVHVSAHVLNRCQLLARRLDGLGKDDAEPLKSFIGAFARYEPASQPSPPTLVATAVDLPEQAATCNLMELALRCRSMLCRRRHQTIHSQRFPRPTRANTLGALLASSWRGRFGYGFDQSMWLPAS